MRTIMAPALAAACLFAGGAQADGFYVSGTVGGAFHEATNVILNDSTDPFGNRASNGSTPVPYRVNQHTDFSGGGEVDIAGGYRFGMGRYGAFRLEAEGRFRQYRLQDYVLQSLPGQVYGTDYRATGETTRGRYEQTYAETANVFYDLPRIAFATPYVGAGVGYQESGRTPGDGTVAYQDTRYPSSASPNGNAIFGPTPTASGVVPRSFAGGSSGDGTLLAEAGVSLAMTQHLSLVPSYRYSEVFSGHGAVVNLVRLGLRYSF
jgi:opacity protein-like surface antigen